MGGECLRSVTVIRHCDRLSAVIDCLAHERRRLVLDRLKHTERSQALADLAEDVAEREGDASGPEIDRGTVKDVYVTLHHVHVPKLADVGLVEYDRDRDTVALIEYPERPVGEAALAGGV